MSQLQDRLQTDLTVAMKARDEVSTATLRMALTAVKNEAVSGDEARELSDAEVITVLTREAKKRRESAQAYDDAHRPELAGRERAELLVLGLYLPTALTNDEISALISDAVAAAQAQGAAGPKAMGSVMKLLSPQVNGRADGAKIAAAVRAALAT
jgi:uncharacterized protein YqeY